MINWEMLWINFGTKGKNNNSKNFKIIEILEKIFKIIL